MAEHAKLSPSSAERWISCPASVMLSQRVADPGSSPYAHEGTLAHALGEMKAALFFGLISKAEHATQLADWEKWFDETAPAGADRAEMELHTDAYVALINDRKHRHPHTAVMLEQRVKTGIPRCWGTSDTVLVSPTHVEVIDLKYGTGVPVSAVENPQLMLYGVGALEEFGDMLGEAETVFVTVFQPRIDNTSTYEIPSDELRAWRDGLKPIAATALKPGAKFGPSETACRWCPVKGQCRARMEYVTGVDFGADPDLLSPAEMADVVGRLPDIRDWCTSAEERALHMAYSEGTELPGWKVVMSGGRRSITDPAAAIDRLVDAGYDRDAVSERKVTTLGALEKLVGKKELPVVLDGVLVKGSGRPALVPLSDGRPAVSPASQAAADFEEEN